MTMGAEDIDRIRRQARNWIVELSSDDATTDQRAAFKRWLNTDPRHAEAFEESRRIWGTIGAMRHLEALTPADALTGPRRQGARADHADRADREMDRRWRPVAAAAVAAAVMVGLLGQALWQGDRTPEIATRTAELRDVTLDDGSVVTLGPKSSITVGFTQAERRVALTAGEAFFAVVDNPARPFVVTVGDMRVRVVGTQFDVHHGPDAVRVSVLEGSVEVTVPPEPMPTPPSRPETTVLTAGQQIVATHAGRAVAVRQVAAEASGAWRLGRLSYQGASLREVIADANRYYDGQIVLASDEIGALKVTASFRTDRIDQMINVLVMALPIQAERQARNRILLKPAAPHAG